MAPVYPVKMICSCRPHPSEYLANMIEFMGYSRDQYLRAWAAAAEAVNSRLDEIWELAVQQDRDRAHRQAAHLRDKFFLSILNKLLTGKRCDDAYLKADGMPLCFADYVAKRKEDRTMKEA